MLIGEHWKTTTEASVGHCFETYFQMPGLLLVLSCTLFSSNLVEGVLKATDPLCYNNCKCCKDEECRVGIFGWTNACTLGCIDGHRGARCYELCQHENCRTCGFTATLTCTACYDGYFLGPNNDCTNECPYNCLSCNSSTFCTECKEGFYDKDGSTTCNYWSCPRNCVCSDGLSECISCQPGYYETTSLCNNTCPVNCISCASKESCGECQMGFYNEHSNDSATIPPINNCSYKCRDTCMKCYSSNNCSQCSKGKYGLTCQEKCSAGCIGGTCSIESGVCNCSTNFKGDKCMACIDGKYGNNCNLTCPEYCKGRCSRLTGYCINGCVSDTLVGNKCITCKSGLYGELCDKICPVNCKDKTCERYIGICSNGCEEKFNGTYCDSCISGLYGQNCEQSCPDKCTDGICAKLSGNCLSCLGNSVGPFCDTCKPGYFGPNCNYICSSKCTESACDRVTGHCTLGCIEGFSGDRCCVEGENCMNCTSNTECGICTLGYFQSFCRDKCPAGCKDSCEFSTGVCYGCQMNSFGTFCTFTCSENCMTKSVDNGSICAQSDGKCLYGCKDSYYGFICDKKCSSVCVGNVCRQDNGICVHGCVGKHDGPECSLGSTEGVVETSTVVLGTLFALSLLTNLAFIILFVRRRKNVLQSDTPRQQIDVSYENQLATANIIFPNTRQNETNTPAERMDEYEVISKADDDEHQYQLC